MDNLINKCPYCNRRVLRHSRVLQCCVCKNNIHRECIPLTRDEYNQFDIIRKQEWLCKSCCMGILPFHQYLDDEEFLEELYLFFHKLPYALYKINRESVFNPIEYSVDQNQPLDDCDPDSNYYSEFARNIFQDCLYYSSDEFNEMYENYFTSSSSVFALGHLNIRSIPAHLTELDAFLSCLSSNFSIIAITENWLTPSNYQVYGLHGYHHEPKYRQNKAGGGVSLLIANHLNYTVRHDLSTFNDYIEALFIEMDKSVLGTSKNVIVGVIYRPHTDPRVS